MKHGTRYNYQTGCRCARCVRANRRYVLAWLRRRERKKVKETAIKSVADLRVFEIMHGLPVF